MSIAPSFILSQKNFKHFPNRKNFLASVMHLKLQPDKSAESSLENNLEAFNQRNETKNHKEIKQKKAINEKV